MPPKGYVGIEVTARRKMLLREVMTAEGFRKPVEALDFAIAFAQKFVKVDAELTGETNDAAPFVPDFINYYVGDARSLTPTGDVGPLLDRALAHGVGIKTAADWRLSALDTLRNIESTSMTLTDAVDFALTSYLMHQRAGTVSETEREEIKAAVRAGQVAYRSELRDFRKGNMTDVEHDARIDGTKSGTGERKPRQNRKRSSSTVETIRDLLGTLAHERNDTLRCEPCTLLRDLHVADEQRQKMHLLGTASVPVNKGNDDDLPF